MEEGRETLSHMRRAYSRPRNSDVYQDIREQLRLFFFSGAQLSRQILTKTSFL